MEKYQDVAILFLRLATAANFLSPVADRFGLWGKHAVWGDWQHFLDYTAKVNSFAPASIIPKLAVVATILEIVLPIMLLIGFKTRLAAFGAFLLTGCFALAMTYSFGIKAPLDYAVFVDCASALLLATMPRYKLSVDELLKTHKQKMLFIKK